MSDEKVVQFANFNITFGEDNIPMLEYFEDIIFPVFTGGYIRGKQDVLPRYSFSDVKIKCVEDEYILVGNYIKDTEYNVVTTVNHGALIPSPAQVPTAPYSRFIIFLKNHRMVLVKNEVKSPDIRSFQSTVRVILGQYIRIVNKGKFKSERLPSATVNIVDIPLQDSIDKVFQEITKIKWLKLRFFPLNNDLNPLPLAEAMKEEMKNVKSKTGNLMFNSPESKEGVKVVLNKTAGLACATMKVTDEKGEIKNIKENAFSSSKKIIYKGNIDEKGDNFIIDFSKKDGVISNVSKDNQSLYERLKEKLKQLMLK